VSAWSFVQRNPTDCAASKLCDLDTSRIRGHWLEMGRSTTRGGKYVECVSVKVYIVLQMFGCFYCLL